MGFGQLKGKMGRRPGAERPGGGKKLRLLSGGPVGGLNSFLGSLGVESQLPLFL